METVDVMILSDYLLIMITHIMIGNLENLVTMEKDINIIFKYGKN